MMNVFSIVLLYDDYWTFFGGIGQGGLGWECTNFLHDTKAGGWKRLLALSTSHDVDLETYPILVV